MDLPSPSPWPAGSSGCEDSLQPMTSQAGTSFEDSFGLSQTKLGDGMTATVFVATHKATGRLCACKLAERKVRNRLGAVSASCYSTSLRFLSTSDCIHT